MANVLVESACPYVAEYAPLLCARWSPSFCECAPRSFVRPAPSPLMVGRSGPVPGAKKRVGGSGESSARPAGDPARAGHLSAQ